MTGRVITGDHFGGEDDGFELSPQDERILELNHEGHSARKISEILESEGMPLSKNI